YEQARITSVEPTNLNQRCIADQTEDRRVPQSGKLVTRHEKLSVVGCQSKSNSAKTCIRTTCRTKYAELACGEVPALYLNFVVQKRFGIALKVRDALSPVLF